MQNTSIAYVGVDSAVKCLEDDLVAPYLARIADVPRTRMPGAARDDQQRPPGDDDGDDPQPPPDVVGS